MNFRRPRICFVNCLILILASACQKPSCLRTYEFVGETKCYLLQDLIGLDQHFTICFEHQTVLENKRNNVEIAPNHYRIRPALFLRRYEGGPFQLLGQGPSAEASFLIPKTAATTLTAFRGSIDDKWPIWVIDPGLRRSERICINLMPLHPGTYYLYWRDIQTDEELIDPNLIEPDGCDEYLEIFFHTDDNGSAKLLDNPEDVLIENHHFLSKHGLRFFQVIE